MGGYTKREIVGAVVEALRPLSVQGGGYVRQLEARGLNGPAADAARDALQLPAVFVSYSSSTYSQGQYMQVRETVGFEVTVVLLGGREREAERLLDDIRSTLFGSTLGLDVGPVTPHREAPLSAGGDRAVFTALYSVTQGVPVTPRPQNM